MNFFFKKFCNNFNKSGHGNKCRKNKIGLFLKDRGYVRILKTVVSKNDTVCYKGLKIKTEPEEEYVVEEENQSPE